MVTKKSGCNECFDSDSFCIGECDKKNYTVYTCDECDSESEDLYEYYGQELCKSCLREKAIIKEFFR